MYEVPHDPLDNNTSAQKMRKDVRDTIEAQAKEEYNRMILVRGSLMAAAIALNESSAQIVIDECKHVLNEDITDDERKVAQVHLDVTTAYLELIQGD